MADASNDEKRLSWKEPCQDERGESGGSKGWISKNVKPELSVFDDPPKERAGKPQTFKELVVRSQGSDFVLVPGGNNSVRCLHGCFVFGSPEKSAEVIRIPGARLSSQLKSSSVGQAVKQSERAWSHQVLGRGRNTLCERIFGVPRRGQFQKPRARQRK